MALGKLRNVLLGLGVAGTVLCSYAQVSLAGDFGLDCWRCPPPYCHRQEGPPRLKFKCVCPRPVCGPCDLQHFGYYPTCWSPYPWLPDYSCCPAPAVPAPYPPPAPPAAVSSLTKLPEPDFSQPASRAPGQTVAHPSPYHGQGVSPASDVSGR
jgi:hypothetical protein